MAARGARAATARRVAGDRSRRGLTPTMRSSLRPRSDLGWLLGDWTPPLPPAPATESDALGLPPFGRGLDLIAGTIAGLVWRAMSWDADLGIWQRIAKQPNVLTDP